MSQLKQGPLILPSGSFFGGTMLMASQELFLDVVQERGDLLSADLSSPPTSSRVRENQPLLSSGHADKKESALFGQVRLVR